MILLSIVFVVMFSAINVYFFVAEKFNIIDKPNHRSSHKEITIRGGGILFYLAYFFYELFLSQEFSAFLFSGITLLAIVSFIDDLKGLPSKVRFPVQILSIALVLIDLNVFSYPFWIIVLIMFIATGFLNAYNFMDGINGITALYSLAVLGSIHTYQVILGSDSSQMFQPLYASLLVFGFYNVRKKAKCFSGDIGSITVGALIIYLLTSLTIKTETYESILFVSVYLVDSGFTILIRLLKKENIFEAHRSHLYQVLVNEKGYSHLSVSTFYACGQIGVNFIVILNYNYMLIPDLILILSISSILITVYWVIRVQVSGSPLHIQS
ncbi:MAG: glycosyltransferase family 4 protein [Cyclobacteriaceae bacterium]